MLSIRHALIHLLLSPCHMSGTVLSHGDGTVTSRSSQSLQERLDKRLNQLLILLTEGENNILSLPFSSVTSILYSFLGTFTWNLLRIC